MKVFQFIYELLKDGIPVMLLQVVYSQGSSPGRQGFRLAVSKEGKICGTIGGGIMEHKLVEKSKKQLSEGDFEISFLRQFHDTNHSKNRSGMICSGEQFVVFVPFYQKDLVFLENILTRIQNGGLLNLEITKHGISTIEKKIEEKESHHFQYENVDNWKYIETLGKQPLIHIFGAGHVGLALSEIMNFLGFQVKIYDNRANLNTLKQNGFVAEKQIIDYRKIPVKQLQPSDYVAIMTFGYRDDKIIFKQLLPQKLRYLGLMGSRAKIKALLEELEEEGIPKEQFAHAHTPIGLDISSKTSREIAISVAAQIIQLKNEKKT